MTKTQKAALSFFYTEYPEEHDFETTLEMSTDHLKDGHFKKRPCFSIMHRSQISEMISYLYAHMILELGVKR